MITAPIVSSYNLSTLASGSKQIIVHNLQEGEKVEIPMKDLVSTASYSTKGVATKLTIMCWKEDTSAEINVPSILLIRATTSESGNSSLIPLVRTSSSSDVLQTYFDGYSTGASSTIVSSSRDSEKVVLEYDATTLNDTYRRKIDKNAVIYQEVATVATLNSGGLLPSAYNAEVLILRDLSTGFYYLVARKNTALDAIYRNAYTILGGSSTSVRFSIRGEVPKNGSGWSETIANNRKSFLLSDVILNTTYPIITFLNDLSAPAGANDENVSVMNAYPIYALNTAQSSNLLYLLFNTPTPATGAVAVNAPDAISRIVPPKCARSISFIMNARQIFNENEDRSGGIAVM